MSSKKLFSMIHGQSVHIAPDTKIIDAESVQTLCEAKDVLDQAHKDAVQYREEVAAQCEKEREAAQAEGFRAGMERWVAHIAELEKQLADARGDALKILVPVTIKAAQKIVGRELEMSKEAIVDIIANNLKAVSAHRNITIWVNPGQLTLLQGHQSKLKQVFENLESLALQPRDDISENSCVIETEVGIISAEMENQWMHLEAAIEEMIGALK